MRRTSPHYAGLTQPAALSLEEVQSRLLDEESVLLEYALGDERSFLWVVARRSITSYEVPKRSEVEALARRVYELLTARNLRPPGETVAKRQARVAQADRDFDEAASRLSRMVLGPALPVIGTKRLLVVADGALQYVPFAALPKPTASGGDSALPLIVENEVVALPSASVLAVIRREARPRKPGAKSVAVLADPRPA
jgi:hypothetical protein